TQRIRVITTAFLPAYASTSLETLQSDCLSTSSAKISDNFDSALTDKQTLADCLANHNVPFSTQVQEFNYTNKLTEITAPYATYPGYYNSVFTCLCLNFFRNSAI
ncbi:hypothetical protein, partial [Staphylococcus aureus]|uniref:hypothetical protein n=1 Tax=Staphylococcus aureus TaxID=1280 RepID=UPI001C83E524